MGAGEVTGERVAKPALLRAGFLFFSGTHPNIINDIYAVKEVHPTISA
jgi:hypothetical protein